MGTLDKIRDKIQAGLGHTKKAEGQTTDDPAPGAEANVDPAAGKLEQSSED